MAHSWGGGACHLKDSRSVLSEVTGSVRIYVHVFVLNKAEGQLNPLFISQQS
jgi:hypothetical protein